MSNTLSTNQSPRLDILLKKYILCDKKMIEIVSKNKQLAEEFDGLKVSNIVYMYVKV